MAVRDAGAGAALPALAGGHALRRRQRLRRMQGHSGFAMTTPFFALFAVFFAGPLVYSVILSLRSPLTGAYAGLLNYRTTFANGDYWSAVARMGYFGLIQVTVMIGLAIGLALLLDSPYCRGRRVFSLVYFLPYAVPGVIAALMWGFLLEPDLDVVLKVPHLLGLTGSAVQPLDYRLSLYSIMLIVTWEWTGYNMTVLLTSLTSVPRQVLEAAKVDGASELSIAARIKLPMVRRTVVFIAILSIIGTLQLFNEPVILNEVASVGNALTPNQIIYNTAFAFGNEQTAAAQSVVLALITLVATAAFFGIVRRRTSPLATTSVAR
ncbi:MAG TPA: sugar ABC transporter permease [Acidimicrobiales bacterium]|nr:sugar ABC transporter permease [Acidimicrobiales bacterium]